MSSLCSVEAVGLTGWCGRYCSMSLNQGIDSFELRPLSTNTWRQMESFRILLQVAASDGNYLQRSWYPVLKCISALDVVNVSGALKRASNMFSVWGILPQSGRGSPSLFSFSSAHVPGPPFTDISTLSHRLASYPSPL